MSVPARRTRAAPLVIASATAVGAALAAALVLALGVAAGRPDVAVVAVPVLLTSFWAGLRRPARMTGLRLRSAPGRVESGEIRADLTLDSDAGVESVLVRVAAQGYRSAEALLAADRARVVGASLQTARTGVHELFRVDTISHGFGAVLTSDPATVGPIPVAVHPLPRPLAQMPLPFRLAGLTGNHTSRRVGEGYEVHDVHEFAPGDRLKRIDWRVSARRAYDPRTGRLGTLYARRTFATADATVMIVIDSRDDVGPDVETWAGGTDARMDAATSLDIAREAATAIARAYLDMGDRVGLDDLGRRRRPVPPGVGRGHAERLAQRLLRVAPEGWPDKRERAPQLPSGALVVLCSTFLDDEAARMGRQWRSHGHRVIAVDTVPRLSTRYLTPLQDTAFRLIMLDRAQRIRELRRTGVEVVGWNDTSAAELHAAARSRTQGGRR